MDEEYLVIWTESAVSDLESIIEYVAGNNPLAAKTLLARIQKQVDTLSYLPQRGRHIPELREQGILLYRELIIFPWRIMYRIQGKTVYVMAIIDSRRNVEDILLEKLIKVRK